MSKSAVENAYDETILGTKDTTLCDFWYVAP